MSIGSLNGVAWEKVENQQANSLVVVSAIRQFFIALARHQFVQCHRRGRDAFNSRLRGDDDWLVTFYHNALKPDIIIENAILQIETVEIF